MPSIPTQAGGPEDPGGRSSQIEARIQAALQELRAHTSDEAVADLLARVAGLESSDSPDAFTEAQEDVLAEAGMPPVASRHLEGPRARSMAEHVRLLNEAYTTAQVAEMLDVSEDRVRQHASSHTLLSWKGGRKAFYPLFQFTADGQIVRGWSGVAPHFPRDVHPVAVEAFLHRESEELEVGERNASPLEWLSAGGDPDAVADLVDDAYRIA